MISIEKKSDCCGCGACMSICPKKAITMKRDDEGFAFPVVNRELCTNCGLCDKVCSFRNKIETHNGDETVADEVLDFEQRYYAAYNKDVETVFKSSSGGIFTLLTDAILEQGGVVYGVYMDEAFKVRTGRATDAVLRDAFVGSKYVQSNAYEVYEQIMEDLRNGLKVLFSGTPCQVAAVNELVKARNISADNLYLVDFVCHGVSSPRVWKDYVEYLSSKYEGLVSYVFRGKKKGWHGWYPIIQTGKGEVSEAHKENESFIRMYQTLFFVRRSCFKCPYTSYVRVSDITLADFWNVDSFAKEMDDNTGTSELLVNTSKGYELLMSKKDMMELLECSKEEAWQPHLEYPNHLPKKRRQFWATYEDEGAEVAIRKYGKGDAMTKLKNVATPVLKKTGLYTLAGKTYKKIFVKK